MSEEAAQGWRNFSRASGVSLTALIEAAGRDLLIDEMPSASKLRRRIVEAARKIDLERRRRAPGSD